MVCMLTHVAVYDPQEATRRILDAADRVDGKTRPLAKELGVSYPTVLRLLDRLDLREKVRDLWTDRKKEAHSRGLP